MKKKPEIEMEDLPDANEPQEMRSMKEMEDDLEYTDPRYVGGKGYLPEGMIAVDDRPKNVRSV